MNQGDKDFLKQSKKILDDSVDSLDAATLSRLNQARQKAIQRPISVAGFFARPLPVTAVASMGVAVIAAWLWMAFPEDKPSLHVAQQDAALQYEDLEILISDTELELLDQLEFVSWLIEQELEHSQEQEGAG